MMFAAAALLTAALVAQATPRDTRAPQTDETINVAKGSRLTIENFAGEVVLRTWNRDTLRVQARHTSRAKVNIRTVASGVSIKSESGGAGSVDYEITSPEWMPIRVQGTYIYIGIEGAQGEVSAETTRGDIQIRGGTGTITARSIQGEVIVEGARGRINVSSVSEDVRLKDVSGDVTAETSNGHVFMTQVRSANVEASTINGNILFEGPPADRGRYRFTTHNGTITAVIPENANVSFIVRTYNGSFSSAMNLNGPPRGEVRKGRRTTYTLGNGSAEMEMESFAGSIRVRRPGADQTGKPEKDKDKEKGEREDEGAREN